MADKIIEGNKIPKHNHSEKAIEAKNKKDNPGPVKDEVAKVVEETKEETSAKEITE